MTRLSTSKYGNVKTEVAGQKFDSRKEAARWQDLTLLEKGGEITSLRRQVRFPLEVGGYKITTYVADFTYIDREGHYVVEDSKGVRTREYVIKRKLMYALHGIEILET